jgi:ribose transport system substrate-binding protein
MTPNQVRPAIAALSAVVALTLLGGCADARPDAGPSPDADLKLEPFDPALPAGSKPDLPNRFGVPGDFDALVAVEIMSALRDAAESGDVEYTSGLANGDLAQFRSQAETMFAQGLGGWWRYPVYDADDLEERALADGVYSVSINVPNVHTILAGDNAAVGRGQVEAAAEWAAEELGGAAQVVILNTGVEDPGSRAWYEDGVLATLDDHPELEVVSDIQVGYTTEESADAIATVLQAHPDVNIVIGHSGPISGALATFEALGRGDDPTVYLSANNVGDDLLARIEAGDSVLRSAWADAWPIYGYGIGLFARDWLDGKSVPKLIAPPKTGYVNIGSPEAAREWRNDMSDPQATWETKRDKYVALYGNISFDTRDDFWTVEVTDPNEVIAQ